MTTRTYIHLRESDEIEAKLGRTGDLVVHIGDDVTVFIPPTNESFTKLCEAFGLTADQPQEVA